MTVKRTVFDVLDAQIKEMNGYGNDADRQLIERWNNLPAQPQLPEPSLQNDKRVLHMNESEIRQYQQMKPGDFSKAMRSDLREIQQQIAALPSKITAKPIVKDKAKPIEIKEVTPQALDELTRLVERL